MGVLTRLNKGAFENCAASSIVIQNGIKTIGDRAFYNCVNITEIHIPSSVTQIGTQIFYKADNLATVYYDSSYSSKDNPFLAEKSIKKVVFGGEYIPDYIAYNATNITDVEISDSVKSIGSYAFYGCRALTSVTIPNSVKSISNYAFSGCSGLISVTIPDSVKSISTYAFSGCSGLQTVFYTGNEEQWNSIIIRFDNTDLTNAMRYYYSENEPALTVDGSAYDGNYWHYDTDGKTPLIWKKDN